MSSGAEKSKIPFNWSKCIFCQKHSRSEKTNCPADSKRSDVGCGYKSLANAIDGFAKLDQLPTDIRPFLPYWDDGNGIEVTCRCNRACWHLKCRRRLLHRTRLDRLQNNSIPDSDELTSHEDSISNVDSMEPMAKTPRLTRSLTKPSDTGRPTLDLCFFCDTPGKNLRQVMTFAVDERVRECAKLTNDCVLQGKLLEGDMIATEAKYHPACLLVLYKKASHAKDASSKMSTNAVFPPVNVESLALADVIAYMEDIKLVEVPAVFKLSDLCSLYCSSLESMNAPRASKMHATRLKERIIENCPNVTAVTHGRDVLLTFNDHVGAAVKQMQGSVDADAIHLMHTAKLIRNEIFNSCYKFKGKLDEHKSVPQGLLSFISMVLDGPGYTKNHRGNEAARSIAQLLIYNACKRRRLQLTNEDNASNVARHSLKRETPLPIYIGLMLHSATGKKKLVDKCHKLGLSISYDRVLQIVNKTTNAVCDQYRMDGVVCPQVLQQGLFTVAAADNIDHNLSSVHAASSFHGTAISIMQFPKLCDLLPSRGLPDQAFELASDVSGDIMLPLTYSEVSPCIMPSAAPIIPYSSVQFSAKKDNAIPACDFNWLKVVWQSIERNEEIVNLSWAAYHAERDMQPSRPSAITALLPMFHHNANTAAMMKHCLIVIRDAIQKLNPGQCPVVTVDQPLYALAKQIQWHFPSEFSENKFVIMMGGLHTEMASFRMLGHWLDGSGWVQSLIQAGLASSGVAESCVGCTHVKRTRYMHTVTAAALFILMQRQYNLYCESHSVDMKKSLSEWREERCKTSVQFLFWDTTLRLQLLVLAFIRSLRLGDFSLYVECLQKLSPWFFVCDQTNYARWIPVHIRDMLLLKDLHPQIHQEFLAGNFTISKSGKKFSAMSIDQAHEQLNALIKGDGGAIGLTENEGALCRWTVAGPEIVRMLSEFEGDLFDTAKDIRHHEQSESSQLRYKKDLTSLLDVLENEAVFSETTGNDLVVLCCNIYADQIVSTTIKTAEETGIHQFNSFVKERLVTDGNISILSPIIKNKFPFFSFRPVSKKRNANSLKITELKTDCELFSRLYVACQSRDGDLDEFFRHENHPYPPSLSQCGLLRFGTKCDMLQCLSQLNCSNQEISALCVDAYILDGAAVVQMLRPGMCKTFEDYRQKVFIPYLIALLHQVSRIDIVFDIYKANSLKEMAREKRGTGMKTIVLPNTTIPSNWAEFLRVDDNKTSLFHFLANSNLNDEVRCEGKVVLATYDDQITVILGNICTNDIQPCNHEEADTRLILHCWHAGQFFCNKVAIRTVDTDVVVLALCFFSRTNLIELWIDFGIGKNRRLMAIHEMALALGPQRCAVLPLFHALTGCDTVSCFYGKGKKTAWSAWNSYPALTHAMLGIINDTDSYTSQSTLSILERFIIIMYDRTSECCDLDSARKQLFLKKCKSLETLPPTSNAFIQHIRRAILQAVICWSHSLEKQHENCDASDWGWCYVENRWQPIWMTLPEVAKSCRELISCTCKKGCSGRCSCHKANLSCTALCHCDGECTQKYP